MSDGMMDPGSWKSIPAQDLRNEFFAARPADVDGVFNQSAMFYRQELMRRLCSLFELSGAPDTWDLNYFWSVIYECGYIGITDTALGVLPLRCGFSGINCFNRPTDLIFTNSVLGDFQRKIDDNGILLQLQYNYMSAQMLIQRYATMLAMCDSSLAVTLMNSKVAFIGLASSKAQSNTMKKMYDMISSGQPAVFVNQEVGNSANFFFNRVKENFVGQELLTVKRGIINEFLTNIGINNANTDKRERLNADEVNANNEEIGINVADWLENLQSGIDKANKMFGLNMSIKRRTWKESEVKENELPESD